MATLTERAHQKVGYAGQMLSENKLPLAECLAREALDLEPEYPPALYMIGIIAAKFGLRDHAIEYIGNALKKLPDDKHIAANLAYCRAMPEKNFDQNSTARYLVIKARGEGFWSEIGHVLGCLVLTEATNRIPIVEWGSRGLYGKGDSSNAFPLYFEAISSADISEFENNQSSSYFPAIWNNRNIRKSIETNNQHPITSAMDFLQRPEKIVVSDVYIAAANVIPWLPKNHPKHGKPVKEILRYAVEKYLKPRSEIISKCEEFISKNFGSDPFVSIHLRGTDKGSEDQNLDQANKLCIEKLGTIDPAWKILLITDDTSILAAMQTRFGNRIVATDCYRGDGKKGIHFRKERTGLELGEDIMLDTYLATYAKKFIGNSQSNVSAMIELLKDWNDGEYHTITESQLEKRIIAGPVVNTNKVTVYIRWTIKA